MASNPQETFISCAITGNLTKPERSPYLPITPEPIATSALQAVEGGGRGCACPCARASMAIELYRQ